MAVDSVGAASRAQGASSEGAETRKASDKMDKGDFLQLLVTQLRYQDPMNPIDDREFAAQLAQFSALEQVTEQTKWSKMTYGLGLVGQNVTYTMQDGGVQEGLVKAIKLIDGKPGLALEDGTTITVDRVVQAAKP